MRDVAAIAGVSHTTVSLVLSGRDSSISAETREKVLGAQRQLGYRVNPFAREFALRTRQESGKRRLQRVAYCLLGVPFDIETYAPFLNGITAECQERQLHLFVQSLGASATGEVVMSSLLRDGHADGLIVAGFLTDASISFLQQLGTPFVVLGNYDLNTSVSRVQVNLQSAGRAAAQRLLERGHKQIAFVVADLSRAYERECLDGVRSQLSLQGIDPSALQIIETQTLASFSTVFLESFLRLNPRPTALVTTNVRVAGDCAIELRARQIEGPGQVDIVTLVDSATAQRSNCYEALNLGLERCGRLAVRQLNEKIEASDLGPSTTMVEPMDWLPSNFVRTSDGSTATTSLGAA